MEIRKVQKTGDMHYVYLPTRWCKKYSISSKSKVNIEEEAGGALVFSATQKTPVQRVMHMVVQEEDQSIINKLIVASYINPLSSFKIDLKNEMDAKKLLNLKNIVSLETVEIEQKTIHSDSSIMLSDPDMLLNTMVKKVKNLLLVMINSYNSDLIRRYEEEIDRSTILIEKSVVNFMTHTMPSKLKMIDLHHISLISRDLERAVDHVIEIDKSETKYLKSLDKVIHSLKEIIEMMSVGDSKQFDYHKAIDFAKVVNSLEFIPVKDIQYYHKRRIRSLMTYISEVMMDWSISNQIE